MTKTEKPKSKTPLTDALPPKRAKFVREYMVDLNATQAALRAGYAASGAKQEGSRLLSFADITAAIAEQMEVNAGVTRPWIINELAKIARATPRDLFTFGPNGVVMKDSADVDDDLMAAIAGASSSDTKFGTTITVKMHDKLGALAQLKEIAGMSRQRTEHTGKDGEPLPPGVASGVFVVPAVASLDDWEKQMKVAQDEQRSRDEAALAEAGKRKK